MKLYRMKYEKGGGSFQHKRVSIPQGETACVSITIDGFESGEGDGDGEEGNDEGGEEGGDS